MRSASDKAALFYDETKEFSVMFKLTKEQKETLDHEIAILNKRSIQSFLRDLIRSYFESKEDKQIKKARQSVMRFAKV